VSGTSRSRRTDRRRPPLGPGPPHVPAGAEPGARLRLAIVAGALLFLYGYLAPYVPQTGIRAGLVLALAANLALFSALIAGLSPLRAAGARALLVAAVAGGLSVPLSWAGWIPAANVAKAVAAAGLGYWLAGAVTSLGVIVLIAGLSAVVDIVSVAWGPTKALIEKAPESVGYLTVAFVWPGYDPARLSTALGVADLVFFALYVGAARAFGLRSAATVAGVALGIAAAVVGGIWIGVMPALPWLAAGFLAVNADLMIRRRRSPAGDGDAFCERGPGDDGDVTGHRLAGSDGDRAAGPACRGPSGGRRRV